jgi:hypothetical protein
VSTGQSSHVFTGQIQQHSPEIGHHLAQLYLHREVPYQFSEVAEVATRTRETSITVAEVAARMRETSITVAHLCLYQKRGPISDCAL